MEDIILSAVNNVLSKEPVTLANSSANLVASRLYATPQTSSIDIAKVKTSYGRTIIASNSLAFGSSCQFQINPNSLLSTIMLCGSVVLPRYAFSSSMLVLDWIQSISYTVGGNSNIQNNVISGESHKALWLAQMKGKAKRDYFLADGYSDTTSAGATVNFAMPLALPFSSGQDSAVWPLDTSALNSNVIITIVFKQSSQSFNYLQGQSVTLPSSFASLYLSCEMSDIQDNDFKISRAMTQLPNGSYNIPTKICNEFVIPVSLTQNTPTTVSLSGMYNAQLLGILVFLRRVVDSDGSALLVPGGSKITQCLLSFNGSTIIDWKNAAEVKAWLNYFSEQGGSWDYTYYNMASISSGTSTAYTSQLLYLPLSHQPQSVLSGADNSVPYTQSGFSYGGQSLSLNFTTSGATGNYILTCAYIYNAVIEIDSRGVSSLVM